MDHQGNFGGADGLAENGGFDCPMTFGNFQFSAAMFKNCPVVILPDFLAGAVGENLLVGGCYLINFLIEKDEA